MTLPEGRQPITPDDMAKLHPSTWAEECEQLRAKYDALREVVSRLIEERNRALAWRDKDWQASQDNTSLITEVYRLRIAITHALARLDASLFTNAEHQQAKDILRAALQQGAN